MVIKLSSLLFFLPLIFCVNSKPHCHLKKVEYNSSLITVDKPFCFIKSYTRNNPLLNVGFVLKRVVNEGKVSFHWYFCFLLIFLISLFLQFQGSYSICRKDSSNKCIKAVSFPDIPFCKILSGARIIPIMDLMIHSFLSEVKNLKEFCTKKGDFRAMNISLSNNAFISKFPSGDYITHVVAYDAFDDNIISITLYTTYQA